MSSSLPQHDRDSQDREAAHDVTLLIQQLTNNAQKAQAAFALCDQHCIDVIVEAAASAARDAHAELAKEAVSETGRGNFEDKTVKNAFAAEQIAAYMRNLKTVGVISSDDFSGITEIAEPVGTVAALTPVTNPTSTTIFKALMCLKTRNPVIFAFHPAAQRCSVMAATIVRDAAISAGAPPNCIQWIDQPSKEATHTLMNHDAVSVILATGGNEMVKAAYSCGKPALGVGAGNVPAYIHHSAQVERAVYDIVSSKSFDNGMICASEQAVIVDEAIKDRAVMFFKHYGCHIANKTQKAKLEKLLFGVEAGSTPSDIKLNPTIVGKSAYAIAKAAGFDIPHDTPAIIVETSQVGTNEPLTKEKLSPVLAMLTAHSTQEGISLAKAMVEHGGLGHTAAIHAREQQVIFEFGHLVQAVRLVENAPCSQGAIGGIFNALIPSLTLGCGSYGRNSVSNNVSALNLINIKRIARRNYVNAPFRTPENIYQGSGTIRELALLPKGDKVTLITNRQSLNSGALGKALYLLNNRPAPVSIQVIDDVPRMITLDYIRSKASEALAFSPDTVVGFGPTAAMNAAKFVRLALAQPSLDLEEACMLKAPLPARIDSPSLVCVPTISGGQAALGGKAYILDEETGMERIVSSPAFLASTTIIDPDFATWQTTLLASRGFETISQATEAFLSVHAGDFTDALVMHGLEKAFQALPTAIDPSVHEVQAHAAREAILSAGTLTSTALTNTTLGLAHAMAQAISQRFQIPRQDLLPAILPNVVRFNGTRPVKLVSWPNYETYRVPSRCEEIVRHLGIDSADNPVEAYARALEDLRDHIGLAASLKDAGMSKKEFDRHHQELADLAFDFQSHSGNPQTARLSDIEILFDCCFNAQPWKR
ncbi:MAG: iron-containing alcohol dehydrogenase [Actinomycetaceae bacterium]|nr:iron-containing alcohol dehydrogenase [Actinomycetaceae bacterium]MDO5746991.1 iron-containing alcohol dehydrogenase [Actinomycetaceae bacterium]